MDRILQKQQYHEAGSAFDFIPTHFSTYGGVRPQAFSSQDVAMNYIFHKGEIHQIGPIAEVNKYRELNMEMYQ